MSASQGSESKADAVVARLGEILQEVDMAITTERQITNKLAEELGEDVYEYKALIRDHVAKFLASHPSQEGAAEATESQHSLSAAAGDNMPNDEAAVGDKRKRDTEDDRNAGPKAFKPSQEDGELAVELSNSRQVRVSKFKGTGYVNIREWYDKDGKLTPGKGISLQVAAWKELTANIDDIATAVSDADTDYACKLSQKHQATVKMFKGKTQVDLREYYEKDGELLPGKKGIALDLPQWEKLVEAVSVINAALPQQQAPSTSQPKPVPAKGEQDAPDRAAAATGTSSTAEGAVAGSSGQTSDLPIQLSAMRKADVSDFKGTVYVSIREYYEKDGKQLPGKKGISLPADQFQKLLEAQASLTAALAAKDTGFEVALSGKRKGSISEFKGKLMVNIREFYEKDGQEKPGAKGISLPPEQWHKLAAGLGALNAALKEQTT
ncbi:hypothetical protein ABBQ32_007412 [Trebouxia sp. C0010 RCD-2024]